MSRPRSVLYEVDPESSWTGYGRVRRNDRLQWAHRWYYEQTNGPIPVGRDLDHLCRTKSCVNPQHLEVVTKAENQRRGDAVRLSWDDVEYIRSNYVPYDPRYGTRALARQFNVCHQTIRKVIHHQAWVDDPALSRR